VIVVDAWLVYSGGRRIRTGMDQREFYELLADQLIDNYVDSVGLRDRPSDLSSEQVPTQVAESAHISRRRRRSARVRALPVLHSRCKENVVSALHRQLTFGHLAWMTAMRADQPGFITRNTTVIAMAYTLGPSHLVKVQLHCRYAA
jgi:hypothetical protein